MLLYLKIQIQVEIQSQMQIKIWNVISDNSICYHEKIRHKKYFKMVIPCANGALRAMPATAGYLAQTNAVYVVTSGK